VRQDGAWRIEHTGYERLYEAMISLKDLPSFNLTANYWTTHTPTAAPSTSDHH
jgi:hypothetical protein